MAMPARRMLLPLQEGRALALLIGFGLSFLVAIAGTAPFTWSSQESFDLGFLFWLRGARPAPDDVVLVPIDGRAARSIYLPEAGDEFERCSDLRFEPRPGYRNPDPPDVLTRWPRCLHARALRALAAAQPEAVVMDISFRPRSDPGRVFSEQDRELAHAMRSVGKVVLVRKIRTDERRGAAAQPIADEIEQAAVAIAPFLLFGTRLQRAEKFCTFIEEGPWSGACLPAVAHQVAALEHYPELHRLLGAAGFKDIDLLPPAAAGLIGQGALHVPVRLIRHLTVSDSDLGGRLQAALPAEAPAAVSALRNLTDVYVGAGIRYFNFYGPPGSFRTIRYESLMDDAKAPAPGSLRGKVVFIGFADYDSPEPWEHFITPFTRADGLSVSGVELAATALANLRDGSTIAPASLSSRALIAFALGLACTLIWVLLPLEVAVVACLGALFVYVCGAFIAFERYSAWLPVLVPLAACVPTSAAGFYARVKDERKRLESVICELMTPRLARQIIEEKLGLRDLQIRQVKGLSINTDIAGYSRLAENHSSEEVAQLIAPYFAELRRIAEDHRVYTLDFAGDSMMASWPIDAEHEATMRKGLCKAALQIAGTADRFRGANSEQALPTRVGVAYGDVSFRFVGDQLKALGDAVNTAQRLQAFNKQTGTRLLVSEPVVHGLDDWRGRELGTFVLDGKTAPVRVCELAGFEDDEAPSRPAAKGTYYQDHAIPVS